MSTDVKAPKDTGCTTTNELERKAREKTIYTAGETIGFVNVVERRQRVIITLPTSFR